MAKSSETIVGKNVGAGAANSLLKEFFVDELKDIFYAEKQIVKTLPKLKKAATSEELKAAFESHLTMTEEHVARLEQVFELLGEKAKGKTCEAIEGIIKEGEGIISETESKTSTRDVGLIFAAQKVEHYEIATYGGLAQLAETLGLSEVAALLHTTLEEEKQTDLLLTSIAENNVNYEALAEKA
ncbi:MAG TPA: ferritin-like domain-containing protein [Segetibacter sp.]|jgi:ferritin-like metal-binding protein YciE